MSWWPEEVRRERRGLPASGHSLPALSVCWKPCSLPGSGNCHTGRCLGGSALDSAKNSVCSISVNPQGRSEWKCWVTCICQGLSHSRGSSYKSMEKLGLGYTLQPLQQQPLHCYESMSDSAIPRPKLGAQRNTRPVLPENRWHRTHSRGSAACQLLRLLYSSHSAQAAPLPGLRYTGMVPLPFSPVASLIGPYPHLGSALAPGNTCT